MSPGTHLTRAIKHLMKLHFTHAAACSYDHMIIDSSWKEMSDQNHLTEGSHYHSIFYNPPHDSGGVLWFHSGLSISSFQDDNMS